MKKAISLVFTLLFIQLSYTQDRVTHSCASDEVHIKALKQNNSYKERFEKNNADWMEYAKKRKAFNPVNGKSSQALIYTQKKLTVVFHDITNNVAPQSYLINSSGSYQYIVDNLNSIYSGANLSPKLPGNNVEIDFCLALQDTNGDSYSVTQSHYQTDLTEVDGDSKLDIVDAVTNFSTQIRFPTTEYINIYIVDVIADGTIGNTAGFASLPPAHGNIADGIFIERTFLMDNINLNNNMNVLAHEMGHYLGLFHVFGICDPDTIASFPQCSCDNTNPFYNGDMVADTPPSKLDFSQVNCATTYDTCTLDSFNDDKSNYMDYGNFSCQDKFTAGQIERIHFMLEHHFGPRESLLNTNSCANCSAMDGCSFTINSPQIGVNNEVSADTPNITFNLTTTCNNSPTLNYTWQITNLDNGNTFATSSGSTLNTTIGFVGNYQIIFTATLSTNSNCFEQTAYIFKVIPASNSSGSQGTLFCNSISNLSWTNPNLERVQYSGGWSLNPGATNLTDYNFTSTARYTDSDSNFEPDSFDIISQGNFNDVNFPRLTLPANVNDIIRVGKIINSTNNLHNGAAYYTKVTFKPTPDNCKFLVHCLGARQITSNQNGASLGFLVQLSYESPFDPGNIKHIGLSEWGELWENSGNGAVSQFYDKYNNVFSHPSQFNSIPVNTYNGVDYVTTGQWNAQLLDFSEFAILNNGSSQNFEVT
ncbi:M43 family zinc metalloprotease [Flavobacterium gelidilacus]|uniref:M43 family zinc metalloprotease n=1 Tax=Flavobacterium gelidilacus TaxID=206041 RepID=UPI0004015324|nr:M43 family zinc metalloprotease [Flavobacterium gelidilacus]